jgi:hypothetical protein
MIATKNLSFNRVIRDYVSNSSIVEPIESKGPRNKKKKKPTTTSREDEEEQEVTE